MDLSHEQMLALASGAPVFVTIEGARCVVLREEAYQHLQQRLEDDELPSPLATSRLIRSVLAEDDADDPALESYQQFKRQR